MDRRPTLPPLRFLSPLHRASRQLGVHLARLGRGSDLAPDEAHVLGYLASYAPVRPSALARALGFTPSTLGSMLDRLEGRGWIARERATEDRRAIDLTLTTKGRARARKTRGALEDLEDSIDGRISKRDYAGFLRVMEAIDEVTGVRLRPRTRGSET